MIKNHFLFNRKIVVATMHQKEKLIAPLFSKAFNSVCTVPDKFDTDAFGTFSGEIERKLDPITTARNKCLKAMEVSGINVAIASEGSFGPHPSLFFAHVNTEIVLLLDKKNNLEFIAQEISTDTNFNGSLLNNYNDLTSFVASVKFPSHSVILRKSSESKVDIIKGINSHKKLDETFTFLLNKYGSVYAETDMRAMHNPSRQLVISKAVENLIKKINSLCPKCEAPGFSITDVQPGLPCEQCGLKTNSILSHIYSCKKCNFKFEKMYPNNKLFEEPMYCNYCNP